MKRFIYSFSGLVLAATAAHAQPAAEATSADQDRAPDAAHGAADQTGPAGSVDPSDTGSEAAPGPAAPAAQAPGSAAVSDTDVENFAKATVKLQAIQADTSIASDQKQAAMAAAVTEAGLDPQKYNEIGAQVSADEALRARVQTAMTRHAGNSDG